MSIQKLSDLKHIACLLWCEGPLMDLAEHDGKLYVIKWVDVNDGKNLFLVYQVSKEDLRHWIQGRYTMRKVELNAETYLLGESHDLKETGFMGAMQYLASSDSLYDPQFSPPPHSGLDLASNRSIL